MYAIELPYFREKPVELPDENSFEVISRNAGRSAVRPLSASSTKVMTTSWPFLGWVFSQGIPLRRDRDVGVLLVAGPPWRIELLS